MHTNRWILYTCALCHNLTAGVVVGWISFEKILIYRDAFRSKCAVDDPTPCALQSDTLSSVFLAGSTGATICRLPSGFVLDKYGPKVLCIVSVCIMIGGCLLLWGYQSLGEGVLFPGYFLLGFGGPSVQLASLPVAELFPARRSMMVGIMAASFDIASLFFLVFKLVYVDETTWLVMWMSYIGILVCIGISGALLWPNTHFAEMQETKEATETEDVNTKTEKAESDAKDTRPISAIKNTEGETVTKDSVSFIQQICTKEWLFFTAFLCVNIANANVIHARLNLIISWNFPDSSWSDIFAVIYPCSVFWAPVFGYLLDTKPRFVAIYLICIIGILYSLFFILSQTAVVLVLAFVFLGPHRPFSFSILFSQVGVMFGFERYGRHVGCITICVAIVAVCLHYLLVAAVTHFWDGDHTWVYVIFILLTSMILLSSVWCVFGKKKEEVDSIVKNKVQDLRSSETKKNEVGSTVKNKVRDLRL